VNLVETNRLLTVVAAVDNRRIDDATVSVWAGILGDLGIDECMQAARRHFATSAAYLLPVHIRQLVSVIRDERRPKSEVLALPSRFEDDDERVQRVRRGIALCAQTLGVSAAERESRREQPEDLSPSDLIRLRAIERARRERVGAA
jgi:hypothetical protein